MTSARDPYKYFRIEARELLEGLDKALLELEREPTSKEPVGALLRFAHTLKGASRVVRLAEVGERAHAFEELLAPHRGAASAVDRDCLDALLKLVDEIRARVSAIDAVKDAAPGRDAHPGAEGAPEPREGPVAREAPAAVESYETVRVEVEEMDHLLDSIAEASVYAHGLLGERSEMDRAGRLADLLVVQLEARHGEAAAGGARGLATELRDCLRGARRRLDAGLEQLTGELEQAHEAAQRVRLLPVSLLFASLERAVRDAARSMQKDVEFRTSGGETRLDAHVLAAVRDALLHVVRNAVTHGIEAKHDRLAAGKPAMGRIEMVVERRGNRVALACSDDGRGIDVVAAIDAAVRAGMLDPAAAERGTPREAFALLLRGGLTTTRTVTDLSGRGIGLDVVREVAARLKGEVDIDSEPGRGTRFEIIVPVSLSSMPALVVEAEGTRAAVPLEAVQAVKRIADADIARVAGGESVVFEGKGIPFVPLARALGTTGASSERRRVWSAVFVRAGEAVAAVGVDGLRGVARTVLRPLPAHAEIAGVVAGASIDVAGNLLLVLEPTGVLASAAQPRRGTDSDARPTRAPLLVVDDSLTTRMLEQSILEAAGYTVELATSGEQGLAMARARTYALFLVDVEMPGMDGFQFVAEARADPGLRHIPAILVTSRASAADRRRGEEAGASAHVAKGEFDQASLLRKIQELVR